MLRKCCSIFNPILKLKNVAENVALKDSSTTSLFLVPHLQLYRDVQRTTPSRNFHCSLPRSKREDKREMLASMPAPDEGTEGEKSVEIDSLVQRDINIYPDKNTFDLLFNGIPFKDIPICNVKVSKNNTIFNITSAKGDVLIIRSNGIEGFKNTRKGTNVAAQATALTVGTKALERGYKTVRVRVQGLGPGRMSAIKGLQMSGLEIISVTDNTPVSWNPPRPRKQRKL